MIRDLLRIVIFTLIMLPVFAHARDDGRYAQTDPAIKKWIDGLKDSQGRGCCSTSDGFRPEEVAWDMAEGAYKVMIEGQWYKVPDGAVITEPNRLGYAVVWYFVVDGVVTIRCFMPGSGA